MNDGAGLRSPSGQYRLDMQADGNLVLYTHSRPLWSSGTQGNPGAYTVMQTDSNLVVYTQDDRPLWNSQTGGRQGGAHLAVQDDANLVVYDGSRRAIWASGSVNTGAVGGESLQHGWYIQSPNRAYKLAMQADSNFVLYGAGGATWSSGTAGQRGSRVAMQPDGNLVLYSGDDRALWHAGTNGHPGARLALQDDGNAVIYDPADQPLWASNTGTGRGGGGFAMPFPCNEVWRAATYPGHQSGYHDPSPKRDRAIDLNHDNGDAWEVGRPVLASAAGTVARSEMTAYGNWIEIDHGGGWTTQYLHLQGRGAAVGATVAKGAQIGTAGGTGVQYPHLHYGQVLNGVMQHVHFDGQPIAYTEDYNGNPYKSSNC